MYLLTDDNELETRVRLCLTDARPELNVIGVQAHGETVRLSGNLTSFYLRQLALEAAKRVPGVRSVVDCMEVHIARRLQFAEA